MTKLELAGMIDHTLLKPDATAEQIKALCREAVEHHFCSVCVNSGRAALAKECIQGSDVKLCVVVGFPLGCSVTKAAEARAMAELGVDEIDMVLDVGLAKDGAWDQVQADIAAVRAACPRQTLKVILETCLLTREEIIKACEAAKSAGADFVKTSTGFSTAGAKKEDVALMKAAAGGLLVKASGGIHSYEEAMEMIDAGASRIGASAGIAIIAGLEETMENVKSVILAAGKGTRLQSEQYQLPKVLREANGQPLLHYVLEALDFLPESESIIVAGYMREKVMEAFPDHPFAIQDEQKGTGHAVQCARGLLEGFDGTVLVCCGDMPLIKKETYRALLETHMAQGNACTFLTGTCTDDLPYGRILRDQEGNFLRVVEDKDCTPEQKKIRELNAGVYAFDCKELLSCLNLLKNENAQGEYYLTDVPELIRNKGGKIGICCVELNEQIIGVNTVEQLRQVEEYLRNR